METSILNPQLQEQMSVIKANKALLERFEFRLLLIRNDFANKTEYEKNEVEIQELMTYSYMEKVLAGIAELEASLLHSFRELVKDSQLELKSIAA